MTTDDLGAIVVGVAIPLVIAAVVAYILYHFYKSGRDMCRWTENNGIVGYYFKTIVNQMGVGIPARLAVMSMG